MNSSSKGKQQGIGRPSSSSSSSPWLSPTVVLSLLVLSNLLVFLLSSKYYAHNSSPLDGGNGGQQHLSGAAPLFGRGRHPILDPPLGPAVALPSVRVDSNEAADADRKFYGGKGDKPHLGGFVDGGVDMMGVSPAAWKWMVQRHGIQSLLDVGCGRGISTAWFLSHGVDAQCVEGSHDAVLQTYLPTDKVTEHDFSRGPWWPPTTVDAVWCVELLEHVGRNFHKNTMPAFRRAGLIYATHSNWGGWHHVEVHDTQWWIAKFESFGFVYSAYLTDQIKKVAVEHRDDLAPNNQTYNAQHVWTTMMVFINPSVASLPQHNHILSEHGCGVKTDENKRCGEDSKLETPLPADYEPIVLTDDMDAEWETLIFGNTNIITKSASSSAN